MANDDNNAVPCGPLQTQVLPPGQGCYTLTVEIDHDFETARMYPSADLLEILTAFDGHVIELAGATVKVEISTPDDDRDVLDSEPAPTLEAA